MLLIGVDTGGTFTDFIYFTDGNWHVLKIPSTPENPALAVLEGLKTIGGTNRRIVHGSTVATNALLERKGAKTALITNKGFEDVIEIGRQNREELYDLHYRKPEPIVPRELRFGIKGRINHRGEEIESLDFEELETLVATLKEKGVESVAVCFLHSYANPSHEKEVYEALERELSLHISPSHRILSEFREYERTSTTVVNAYVSPKMDAYLSYMEKKLLQGDTLGVIQSNGGLISSEVAKKEAVRTVLSGPAGGIVCALHLGNLMGEKKLITFDMGGTSTDVSLIDGKPTLTTESKIEGHPIKIPMIDIHTIGAGGGSIAWIDEGGLLRVGPQSAGSDPGPICYGRGGKYITVTDANLFLGRLVPEHFLGGKMKLFPESIEEPLNELAKRLDTSPVEVAQAVLQITNSNMERALRKVSVHRGHDPSDFSLVTYGGAGALHSAYLAKTLNIKSVIVPRNPGIFSAMGMLMSDVVKDYSLTVMLKTRETTTTQLGELSNLLLSRAQEDFEREGYDPSELTADFMLDMRYAGQSYELTIPFRENYEEEFQMQHEKTYGYRHNRETEIVNLRLRVVFPTKKPPLHTFSTKAKEDISHAILGFVKTAFGGEFIETKLIDRNKLLWGNRIEGPAVVVEYSSTTLIPSDFVAEIDRFGSLILKAH